MLSDLIVFGFAPLMFTFVGLLHKCCREPSDKGFHALDQRLLGYALLKGRVFASRSTCPKKEIAKFEVLLGILKKVEAKNGVMASVWSLILVVGTVALPALSQEELLGLDDRFVVAFIVATLPFLAASILGTRQLDNHVNNFPKTVLWGETDAESETLKTHLRSDLEKDVLMKEELLWVSQTGALLFVVVGLVSIVCLVAGSAKP